MGVLGACGSGDAGLRWRWETLVSPQSHLSGAVPGFRDCWILLSISKATLVCRDSERKAASVCMGGGPRGGCWVEASSGGSC